MPFDIHLAGDATTLLAIGSNLSGERNWELRRFPAADVQVIGLTFVGTRAPSDSDIEASQAPGSAQSLREQRAASIPDGRYAEPHEVANLMMYLCSDLSSHVTGQGIQINGGSHA